MSNQITHRKADDAQTKAFATDYEKFRYAARPEFNQWDDELNELLGDLRGSGWAVQLLELENGYVEYAQALQIGRRHAVAKYIHSREDGITSLEIRFLN